MKATRPTGVGIRRQALLAPRQADVLTGRGRGGIRAGVTRHRQTGVMRSGWAGGDGLRVHRDLLLNGLRVRKASSRGVVSGGASKRSGGASRSGSVLRLGGMLSVWTQPGLEAVAQGKPRPTSAPYTGIDAPPPIDAPSRVVGVGGDLLVEMVQDRSFVGTLLGAKSAGLYDVRPIAAGGQAMLILGARM